MSALGWLLAIGAVWRVTLLIVADNITEPYRLAAIRWLEHETRGRQRPRITYGLTCPWCASVWVAPFIVGSGLAWSDGWGWQLAAGTLTASAVTGWLSSFASPD